MSITSSNRRVKVISYDSFVGGRVTAIPPHKLRPDQSPNMENVFIDEKPGALIERNGSVSIGVLPSGSPVRFQFLFKKADGTEEFLVSDGSTLWATKDGQSFTSLKTGLAPAFDLDAAMVQDKAWLTNGDSSQPVMTYDGVTLVELDGSGILPDPPRTKYLIYALNRVWLINRDGEESSTFFSALTDSSGVQVDPDTFDAWDFPANQLDIDRNDGDQLFGAVRYAGSIYFFKANSIHRLVGTSEQNFGTTLHAENIGTRFRRTIAIVDDVPHFLGPDGVYDMPQGRPRNITRLIQPDFNDILQVDVRQPFKRWSTKAEFDVGTFVDTSSDIIVNSITLEPEDATSFLEDDFANLDDWSNTVGWVIAGGTLTRATLSQSPGQSYVNDKAIDKEQENAYGAWRVDTVVGGNPQDFNEATDIYAYKFIEDQDENGYFLLVNRVSSPGFPTDFQIRLFKGKDNGSGSTTQIGSTNTFQAPFGVNVRFDITRNTDGDFVVKRDTSTIITGNDNEFTSSVKARLWTRSTPPLFGNTPAIFYNIDAVYFPGFKTPGTWTSEAIDTETTVKTDWSIFSATLELNGQDILWEIAADPASSMDSGGGGGPLTPFQTIVPGAKIPFVIGTTTRHVQTRATLKNDVGASADSRKTPNILDTKINWVIGGKIDQAPAAISFEGRYWLSLTRESTGASSNDLILVRSRSEFTPDGQTAAWMYFTGLSISQFVIFQGNLYGGDLSSTGNMLKLDTGSRDRVGAADVAINSFWESKDETFGILPNLKRLLDVVLDFERLGNFIITVGASLDRGATFTTKTINTSGTGRDDSTKNFRLGLSKTWRFRVGNDQIDQPYEIFGFAVRALPFTETTPDE